MCSVRQKISKPFFLLTCRYILAFVPPIYSITSCKYFTAAVYEGGKARLVYVCTRT